MTTEEILALIAQGEGQGIEFKRSLAELETGVRTVAAMANTDGGHVLLGMGREGAVVGVEIGANTEERVVQAIGDRRNVGVFRRSGHGAFSYGTNWRNTTVPTVGAVGYDDGTN